MASLSHAFKCQCLVPATNSLGEASLVPQTDELAITQGLLFSAVVCVSSMVDCARTTSSCIGSCFGASGSGRRLKPSALRIL